MLCHGDKVVLFPNARYHWSCKGFPWFEHITLPCVALEIVTPPLTNKQILLLWFLSLFTTDLLKICQLWCQKLLSVLLPFRARFLETAFEIFFNGSVNVRVCVSNQVIKWSSDLCKVEEDSTPRGGRGVALAKRQTFFQAAALFLAQNPLPPSTSFSSSPAVRRAAGIWLFFYAGKFVENGCRCFESGFPAQNWGQII